MANTIDWGKAAVNNTLGFGQAAKNSTLGFGEIEAASWSGETNITGTPSTPSFQNLKSIALDGVDDRVQLSSDFTASAEFTVSFWMKPTAFGVNGSQYVLGQWGVNPNNIKLDQAGQIHFKIGGTGLIISEAAQGGSNNLVLNIWQHLLFVRDSSNNIKCFRNGVSYGSTSGLSNTNTLTYNSIGRVITNTFGFSGGLDEIAFWNSDQSANLSAIYGSGVPTSLASYSPLHWYRCGDGDVSPILTDNGSGGNDGTMTNFSTFSTDVPTIPFSTKSIALDGVDDFVTFGNMSSFSGATQFTFSGWYKMNVKPATDGLFDVHIDNNNFFNILPFSNGVMYIQFKVGGTLSFAQINYNSLITQGQYFHIAVAYDGSQSTNSTKLKVYIDNVNISFGSSGTFPSSLSSGTNDVRIGSLQYTTALLDGNADECAVFTTQLSASDVTTIYNGGVPNDISSLSPLSWWRCGDGDTAPTLTDNGSASNNGTMTNFTTFSTDVPT